MKGRQCDPASALLPQLLCCCCCPTVQSPRCMPCILAAALLCPARLSQLLLLLQPICPPFFLSLLCSAAAVVGDLLPFVSFHCWSCSRYLFFFSLLCSAVAVLPAAHCSCSSLSTALDWKDSPLPSLPFFSFPLSVGISLPCRCSYCCGLQLHSTPTASHLFAHTARSLSRLRNNPIFSSSAPHPPPPFRCEYRRSLIDAVMGSPFCRAVSV